MRRICVFNNVSLDGYYTDKNNEMSWAHGDNDEEFNRFVQSNAQGESEFLFGRITYEMMASFWPTPQAVQAMPIVAKKMNEARKTVFSKTLGAVSWNNTRLVKGDLISEVRQMKQSRGSDLMIFGSGSLIAQLCDADLIDEIQVVICPTALGGGRSLFEKIGRQRVFKLISSRSFPGGKVFLHYNNA